MILYYHNDTGTGYDRVVCTICKMQECARPKDQYISLFVKLHNERCELDLTILSELKNHTEVVQ